MAAKRTAPSRAIEPSTSMDLFGPAALMEGEDGAAYDRMLTQISGAVHPKDVFEEIWVREIVDLSWEVLRWRRLKVAFLAGSMHEGLKAVLGPLFGPLPDVFAIDMKIQGYLTNEPQAREDVREKLASAGLTEESVHALTLAAKLPQVEQIDRLIASAEGRRNATLREIGRHRLEVADRLRQATTEFDAEPVHAVAATPKTRTAA